MTLSVTDVVLSRTSVYFLTVKNSYEAPAKISTCCFGGWHGFLGPIPAATLPLATGDTVIQSLMQHSIIYECKALVPIVSRPLPNNEKYLLDVENKVTFKLRTLIQKHDAVSFEYFPSKIF